MTAKNQLITVLDFIGENEANQILNYIRNTFLLKSKTWDDIDEDEPLPDEIAVFEEYHSKRNELFN